MPAVSLTHDPVVTPAHASITDASAKLNSRCRVPFGQATARNTRCASGFPATVPRLKVKPRPEFPEEEAPSKDQSSLLVRLKLDVMGASKGVSGLACMWTLPFT